MTLYAHNLHLRSRLDAYKWPKANPELKDLQVFENWPERTGPKVPSKISYSTTSGRHKKLGVFD